MEYTLTSAIAVKGTVIKWFQFSYPIILTKIRHRS
jgi:hypothetical protein